MASSKLTVTEHAVKQDCRLLADKLKRYKEEPQLILAVARGGLHIGAHLAYTLDVPLVSMRAKSYSERQAGLVQVDWPGTQTLEQLRALRHKLMVVDDLVDSGATMATIRDKLPDALYVVLYKKGRTIFQPNFFAREVYSEEWLEFPWERTF